VLRILVVHPVMSLLGGGERLCCETIRVLKSLGHEVTLVSETFDPVNVERFFGFEDVFRNVKLLLYSKRSGARQLGTYSHLIHHIRGRQHALGRVRTVDGYPFDLAFSTQDPGYIPNVRVPVFQWGYAPRIFPRDFSVSFTGAVRNSPLRIHYGRRVARIGLVLAISNFSKDLLDREWRRPSVLVYPACNMVAQRSKRDLVITAARATPEKRLDLFWKIARSRPDLEFLMLLTRDPYTVEYSIRLTKNCPSNGKIVFDPPKKEYHQFLGEAKAYLHLMHGEHFGITVVEAMSAGCVPIVHDSGGPKEIVEAQSGFRWHSEEEIPTMIDTAMKEAPSAAAAERARFFSRANFDERLASVFSGLHA